jgi:hypothetical protein
MYAWVRGGVGGWGSRNEQELAPAKAKARAERSGSKLLVGEVNGLPPSRGALLCNVDQTLFMPHLL